MRPGAAGGVKRLEMTLETQTKNPAITALIDLLIVLAVLVAVKQSVLLYSVVYGGPASTFTAMIVATYLLHRRGFSWADMGFRWPESWLKTFAWTALIFGAIIITAAGANWFAGLFFEDIGTSGRFDFVKGSLGGYLLAMALVWTHAAFFEELLFRAFVITKAESALGGFKGAGLVAAVLAAIFFGYRHYYYQGIHGAIVTGSLGLVFGLFYLKIGRRNILPLILVHGIVNTIGMTDRYLS